MKKTAILASFAATLFFTACGDNSNGTAETNTTEVTADSAATASTDGEAYAVVAEESKLNWNGKKVAGEHSGNINLESGELQVAGDKVVGGTLVIDMTTITNTDIADAENNGKLVGHLKSDDFFGVEKHPTATFTITKVTPIENAAAGAANYNVEGNLEMKGKSNPVSFPATITVDNGVAKAKADVTIDRTQYDIRYGSDSFFDNLGDNAIDNNFTVSFDVTAKK